MNPTDVSPAPTGSRAATRPSAKASRPTGGRAASGPLTAYVLHRYDWSESSLIVDLFTRERGRIAVAAKGAKRPYSQLRGVLLPFLRLQVQLGRAAAGETAEVETLRSADWSAGTPLPSGAALFAGFYLNELLMKLTARHDPHPRLFDAYAETLPALSSSDDGQADAALRAFELALLSQTGVLPDLALVTLTQQPVEPAARYSLLADAGVTAPRPGEGVLTGAVLTGLQAALQHGSPAALRQAAAASASGGLKGVLRKFLQAQLGAAPLRTREVMRGVQNLASRLGPALPCAPSPSSACP